MIEAMMTIVRVLGNKRFLSVAVTTALLGIMIQSALTPQKCRVVSDARWNQATRASLKKEIEHLPIRSLGSKGLVDLLGKEFACIREITISYQSNFEALVQVRGWQPQLIIRSTQPGATEYVLCEKGHILKSTDFTAEALENVSTIFIAGDSFEEKRTTPEFISMAMQIAPEVAEKYTITWYAKTDIILRSAEKNITIVADCSSIHDQARYTYVDRIFNSEERYHRGMKADIRLKDSLVCAPLN